MGLLDGKTVYLCGPIENVSDSSSWRNKATPDLKSIGMSVWSPLVKPNWLPSISGPGQVELKHKIVADGRAYAAASAHVGDPSPWITLRSGLDTNHQTRIVCKRLAVASDIVICRMTRDFTVGTYEELADAQRVGKPVLFWTDEPIPSMWLFDQFADIKSWESIFFTSWDKLFHYLQRVDKAEMEIDPIKWIFLTWET